MRGLDDRRPGRWDRWRASVEEAPLDVIAKWGVIVVASVYALEFVVGLLRMLRGWF